MFSIVYPVIWYHDMGKRRAILEICFLVARKWGVRWAELCPDVLKNRSVNFSSSTFFIKPFIIEKMLLACVA